MKNLWLKLAAKFDALNRRERLMVTGAVIVVLIAVLNALLIDPVAERIKTLTGQLTSDQAQIAMVQQQLQVIQGTPVVDPDAQNHRQLEVLNGKLQEINLSLDRVQRTLVSPDRMAGLLEDLLKKDGQLKLISLKTLPVSGSPLSGGAATGGAGQASSPVPAESSVYRHGVELTVQGRYLDLMNYLVLLEKLPWHMLWGSMKLTTEAYPQSTLTLTIYTLSLNKAWLSI